MKVIVKPNNKIPIRGILAKPFVEEKVIDLTEMQIKRVLGYGAKVYVTSLDGIKAEIKLDGKGNLDTSNIELKMGEIELKGESDHPVDSKESKTVLLHVTGEPEKEEESEKTEEPKPEQQHMTKAQRRAARRAEAQQKAAEEAAKKEEDAQTTDAEDEAKENAEITEPSESETTKEN